MEDLEKDKTVDNYLQNLESSLDEESLLLKSYMKSRERIL